MKGASCVNCAKWTGSICTTPGLEASCLRNGFRHYKPKTKINQMAGKTILTIRLSNENFIYLEQLRKAENRNKSNMINHIIGKIREDNRLEQFFKSF